MSPEAGQSESNKNLGRGWEPHAFRLQILEKLTQVLLEQQESGLHAADLHPLRSFHDEDLTLWVGFILLQVRGNGEGGASEVHELGGTKETANIRGEDNPDEFTLTMERELKMTVSSLE